MSLCFVFSSVPHQCLRILFQVEHGSQCHHNSCLCPDTLISGFCPLVLSCVFAYTSNGPQFVSLLPLRSDLARFARLAVSSHQSDSHATNEEHRIIHLNFAPTITSLNGLVLSLRLVVCFLTYLQKSLTS